MGEHVVELLSGVGAIAFGIVVYLVKISWTLRGVQETAARSLAIAEKNQGRFDLMMPRGECQLREKAKEDILVRIEIALAEIKGTIVNLNLEQRLASLEAGITVIAAKWTRREHQEDDAAGRK